VINSRQTYFRERLTFWQNLGLRSNEGRVEGLAYDNRRMKKYNDTHRASERPEDVVVLNGTSIFNPVLCEVLYKWFTVPNSKVLDPFAGGFVRGAMASMLGHSYTGYDISEAQVKANIAQYEALKEKVEFEDRTVWINDNSQNIDTRESTEYDFVLTCPPYYNLERYTKDEQDLSNQPTYQQFLALYKDILVKTSTKLKEDSFFVIVVSEIRDKKSTAYYGFVPDTINILKNDCGLCYYNEIILYNDTGNLAITSGNYMDKARKVGKQHQNVLVFYKGDISHIKEKYQPFKLED